MTTLKVVAKHAERRLEVERRAGDPHLSAEERAEAQAGLRRSPRDAGPTRVRHRDVVDGQPRGFVRTFGLSRIRLRDMAHAGELSGVTTSSW